VSIHKEKQNNAVAYVVTETDLSVEPIPASSYTLIGVKWKLSPVYSQLSVEFGSMGQPTIFLLLNPDDRIEEIRKLEFDQVLPIGCLPPMLVPIDMIFQDASYLEVIVESVLNRQAKLMIEREAICCDDSEVKIYLTVGQFQTMVTCDISDLQSFLEVESEEEWQARIDDGLEKF